jgi:type III secretion system YscQ/HrcQ family protein
MTMETVSFSWIKKIAPQLSELDAIPLFGNAPPIDWQQLSSLLSSSLDAKITLRPSKQEWREAAHLKKEIKTRSLTVAITLLPLESQIFWTMSQADVDKLTSRLLYKKEKGKTSPVIREGFYRYLLLEILAALQQVEPLQKLTFQLEEEAELSSESSFCVDIEIEIDDKTCWATLILPLSFRNQWITHFSSLSSSPYFPTETARQIELVFAVTIGEILLTQKEWKQLEIGDFLLLDQGIYNARDQTGVALLYLETMPLFHLKIRQNQMELQDYAFTHEEPMKQKKAQSVDNAQPPEEMAASIEEIPLNVTIELSRLKMTLDRLMQLSPGNLLELPTHPEQGVSLTVNGKKVARGELVYLGETLGVRILEIGS